MAWNEQAERMRARVNRRAFGYRALFTMGGDEQAALVDTTPWWAFWRVPRGGALKPAAAIVLEDLAHYCSARKTTLSVSPVDQHVDPLAMAFAEGRRDVFNRIIGLSNLTSDQVDSIVNARSSTP